MPALWLTGSLLIFAGEPWPLGLKHEFPHKPPNRHGVGDGSARRTQNNRSDASPYVANNALEFPRIAGDNLSLDKDVVIWEGAREVEPAPLAGAKCAEGLDARGERWLSRAPSANCD